MVRLFVFMVVLCSAVGLGTATRLSASEGPAELISLAPLHHRLAPAVVGITCWGTDPVSGRRGGYYGTGTIITSEGMVLTNLTVVPADAERIRVTLTDGRVLPAQILETDAASEGALLRIPVADLPHLKLADDSTLAVGDGVIALGNPHFSIQRDGMVTMNGGLVSGRYELASADDQSRYVGPVIESDAMLNGGADGGPLVDAEGQLVGLLSLAYAADRWLGTAIPLSRLRQGLPSLAALPLKPLADRGAALRVFPESEVVRQAVMAGDEATVAIMVAPRAKQLPESIAETVSERPAFNRSALPAAERAHPEGSRWAGVIIDDTGLVLTAASLLDSPPKRPLAIRVFLRDGSGRDATLVGTSPMDDIALLRLKPKTPDERFAALPLVTDHIPAIGTSVVVLGRSQAPGTITANLGRMSAQVRLDERVWQISAAMNYGNVGGPVLDQHGRLLGVAALLTSATPWRQNAGVGFCVTGDRLQSILPLLLEGKTPPQRARAFVGFAPGPFDGEAGIAVAEVIEGSPAQAAGLRVNDRIVAFAGEDLTSWYHLMDLIESKSPGDAVVIAVVRDGQRQELSLTLGQRNQP